MSAVAAAVSRFREVGGITMYVEYHVSSGVAYLGVWVCGAVVEKPEGICILYIRQF